MLMSTTRENWTTEVSKVSLCVQYSTMYLNAVVSKVSKTAHCLYSTVHSKLNAFHVESVES